MPYLTAISLFLFALRLGFTQETTIKGRIVSDREKKPLVGVKILVEETLKHTNSTIDGRFTMNLVQGTYILNISLEGYVTKRLQVTLKNKVQEIGALFLERDIVRNQSNNLIAISDAELLEDEASINNSSLLQASRDLFLNRAAFDFGQAFFRVRGYDAQYGKILINGLPMNKFHDGRPQWNNWGGLNDVMRNQKFSLGLQATAINFGDLLGTSNIDTRPSKSRSGTRISSSMSNRTYAGRFMVTYTSPRKKNMNYVVSSSRRWASQGYNDGTLYDAFSVFGAIEYQMSSRSTVLLSAILASNRRGRSSALTEEVFELLGRRFNPNWGMQNGKIRNSKERKIQEPIVMLNYLFEGKKFQLNTGIAYQFGKHARGRLGYYNAPNPDPIYYRYLPSFYINSSIGANFRNAEIAREGLLQNQQIDWSQLYTANSNGRAAYMVYDDVIKDEQLTLNGSANVQITDFLKLDFGVVYQKLNSKNFAQINDLLGADFHEDIDTFSNTKNDISGNINRETNDIFNYYYDITASQLQTFAQFRIKQKKWNAFISGSLSNTGYQRNGHFQNERYLNNSLGPSESLNFKDVSAKMGLDYSFNSRHNLQLHGALMRKPPTLQNAFVNPRENNQVVPQVESERVEAVAVNYNLRLPKLTGRITGYHTQFKGVTDVNFFFVDSGIGSDFVQEVLTDIKKTHSGIELGLAYQISSAVQLNGVAALGKFVYSNNPSVAINFDTSTVTENGISDTGNVDLGRASIKGYKLAQGPQQAFALGINYRDPKYWWVGTTANYMTSNYGNISTITRTESFYIDPETNAPFPDATDENVSKLLTQKPLDSFYLLNLVGGKSWLKNGKYISVFASINNVFDAVFRTGGYEQSRNGNFGQLQQDNLSGTPSFAPKYWYGYGRTYFLNVAFSF